MVCLFGRSGVSLRDAMRGGADDAELLRRTALALELMFFNQGVPVVYYGDEQGITGDGGDYDARQHLFASRVASYNDDDLIGTEATTADDNFDEQHPLFRTIADLARLRAGHPALRVGSQVARWSESAAGVYAFSRIERSERIEYLVVLNNAEEERTVGPAVASPSTRFDAVYPAGGGSIESDPAGVVSVTVPRLGAAVYRAATPLPVRSSAPAVVITSPQMDAEVRFPRVRLEAETEALAYVEVTFAVSVDGGQFVVVGTDDAAPYRVFWDSSQVPDGATVEVMATVDDLTGGRSVASGRFTIGDRP